MLMREEKDMVENKSRSEMYLDGERIVGREHFGGTRRLGGDERGAGYVAMSENGGDRDRRNYRKADDQYCYGRGNDTASKFQWTYLLEGSGRHVIDGVERGFKESGNVAHGRRYDGLVEKSGHVDRETNRNVSNYSRNGGRDEYHGVSRDYHGVNRDEYHGNFRNVTDLRAEDHRNSRNMTSLNGEDAKYRGIARVAPSVEGDDYKGRTRSLSAHLVDYEGRYMVKEYPRYVIKESDMKSYKDGNWTRYRVEDDSHSLTPYSQTSDQHSPYWGYSSKNMQGPRSHQESIHHLSDGVGTHGSAPCSSCCGSHRLVCSTTDSNACPVTSVGITSRRDDHNQNLGRLIRYIHPDSQGSGKVFKRAFTKDNFDTREGVAYYDDCVDVCENDSLDPPLPRLKYDSNSSECRLEEDRLHSSVHTLQQVPMVDINVKNRTAHGIDYEGVDVESMNEYLEYGPDASHETLLYDEEYPSDFIAYGVSHEDQIWNNEMLEEGAPLNFDENVKQNLGAQDVGVHSQPKRKPKRKCEFVEKMSWPKHRTSTLGGRGPLSFGNKLLPSDPENELVHPTKRLSHHDRSKVNARMSKTEHNLPFGGLSKELQSRLSKPIESGTNDIKSRLKFPRFVPRAYGPQASKLTKGSVNSCVEFSPNVNYSPSIAQPYAKVKPKSVKKGHKLTSSMHVGQPDYQVSHPGLHLEQQQKLAARSSGTTKENGPSPKADTDHSIFKVKPTEKDPPENSEELKGQVDHWFLKCILYLNANPGRRKKFELGNAGSLKCIICSSGKEFAQTKDIATHAFTSLKVGLVAPHLGFHRALCFLMGWDPEVANNGRWVCKPLPDVEARALKEDIILWPPVLVIHSGSPRDFYDVDQVKVSIEQLESILRDMGLSEVTASVCYGKPGNSNIMLVKFSGTLSGLQEAQRLHNVFAEKKHGRFDLLEIVASSGSSKEVDQKPEDKVEDMLYGYLGIVEDFDKLNYNMRQRYVAKSKKEILARVDNTN